MGDQYANDVSIPREVCREQSLRIESQFCDATNHKHASLIFLLKLSEVNVHGGTFGISWWDLII
jgi:hypothetical protein